MSTPIETLIIAHLIKDEAFTRKALPNMRADYFRSGEPERVAFELVERYVDKYSALPSPEALVVELNARTDLSQDLFARTADLLGQAVTYESNVQQRWMLDQTEQFCQDRAIHNALRQALGIISDKGEKGLSRGSIPKMLQDALAVTFDPNIGHDYIEDAASRFDEYLKKPKKVPFDVKVLNEITKGGLNAKTLNVAMAISGAGKSLLMCHMAAANLMMGKNVLYITLELSQEMVSARVDANLMGVDIGMLGSIPRDVYLKKIQDIRSKTTGKIVVKEYSQAGASHFRHLLTELKTKKNFVPDVIYVDYLNICVPTGRKGEMNSYERVKCIAEELRAIAVDYDVPVFTATQSNRSAYGSSSVGMESVSESLGLPMTADLFFALVQTDELKQLGQYKVVQLKSRYDDIGRKPFFFLGVDKPTMRIYDLDEGRDSGPAPSTPDPVGQAPGLRSGKVLNFGDFK